MEWNTALDSLEPPLRLKAQALYHLLRECGSLLVAFSGGVDSALVASVGFYALGDRMLAVTVRSPVETPGDHEYAVQVAQAVGFKHLLLDFDDFSTPHFVENPPERCYHCKLARFQALLRMARERGVPWLAEGSNADDRADYRPGARAVQELGVRSPLAEAGLGKAEIRAIAKALEIPVWNRPSAPCLATRFPYGSQVTLAGLQQVATGEEFLKGRGYMPVRVRHFGETARLEVAPDQVARLAAEHEDILPFFKGLGFAYVVVDLAGYRSGALNEVLK